MKKTISIGIIFLMLIVTMMGFGGCSQKHIYEDETVSVNEISKRDVDMELYVREEIELGKYEPFSGIYLGAYVEKNKDINKDILAFEEIIGHTQTFKVFQYTLEEGLSSQEILKCMAQRKVPYIKLLLGKDFDLVPLYRMISDIKASYNVPIFIELFPVSGRLTNPIEYKETYQRAYEVVKKYLEQSVVVWSIDDSRLYDMPLYYPGDEFVDWAGINIYVPQYKNGMRYTNDHVEAVDFWYKSFQKTKPMIISSLAISHYSRVDHTYTLQDAQNKLGLFYKDILSVYPRIKGVLYIDVDMEQVSKSGKEDYRITSQKQLVEYMKKIFKSEAFLEGIEELEDEKKIPVFMKYSIVAAQFNSELYLPQKYMSILFKKIPLSKLGMTQDLNGDKFYRLEDIGKYAEIYYEQQQ
ncbi:MAG: hypothetical protein K0S30_901 [Clostridia bacterium]|nr:hypothetical protein [Clostridia bacterium]